MFHIGCACPELSGHLNPMIAVARQLQSRGHRVTFIGRPDAEKRITDAQFEFRPVGEQEYPIGSIANFTKKLGTRSGGKALKFTVDDLVRQMNVHLRDVPPICNESGFDGLLFDQITTGAISAAEYLGIPVVSQANALIMNREVGVPPPTVGWSYSGRWLARLRNSVGWAIFERITKPLYDTLNAQRAAWDLRPYALNEEPRTTLAEISQEISEFEFPRHELSDSVHFLGPFIDGGSRQPMDFPFDCLSDKPLIYASMGTLQNQLTGVFRTITDACEGIGAQLVVSLGSADSRLRSQLPEWPIVVDFAPQLDLLKRASLTITHAGLNTTLESLNNGVPMVAIPVTNDQPGVASRISHAGVGTRVSLNRLTAPKLRKAIVHVMECETYRANAQRLQNKISEAGGVSGAADIIEQAISTREPVLAKRTAAR